MRAGLAKPERTAMLRPALLVLVSTTLLGALALGAPPWLRVPAATLWVLVIPGLPWALRMRLPDPGDTAAVALALSMALAGIVGGGMAVLGTWSPVGAVLVLGGLAVAGAVLPGVRRPESSSRRPS